MLGCGCGRAGSALIHRDSFSGDASSRLVVDAEVAVVFHEFLNIDLGSQGWYAVRVSLSTPGYAEAWPSRVISKDVHPSRPKTPSSSARQGGALVADGWQLEEETRSFRTRVFNVRFCSEQVTLDEVVCFGLSINLWEGAEVRGVALDVELLFQEGDKINPSQIPFPLDLKPVSKRRIDILRPACGVHEFLPVTFDELYLACTKISVHSVLLGFSGGFASEDDTRQQRALIPERRASLDLSTDVQELDRDDWIFDGRASAEDSLRHLPALKGATNRDIARMIVPETAELGNLGRDNHKTEDVGDTLYFPPDRVNDLLLQEVTTQHPVAESIRGIPQAFQGSKLGRQLSSEFGDSVPARTMGLHRAMLEPLLESYNVLVSNLKSLPSSCYAPQSLETLRLVMLSGADQKHGNSLKGVRESVESVMMRSPMASMSKVSRLPSLNITEEGAMREVQEAEWRQAIEEGRDLSYQEPVAATQAVSMSRGGTVETAATYVLEDLKQVSSGVLANWACLLWVARHANGQIAQVAERNWLDTRRDDWAPWVLSSPTGPVDHFVKRSGSTPSESSNSSNNFNSTVSLACGENRLEYRNKQLRGLRMEPTPRLQDQRVYVRPHDNPVLYIDEDLGQEPPEPLDRSLVPDTLAPHPGQASNPRLRRIHVVVFVHGFQGNSTDLRLIKSHLQVLNPKIVCLMSKGNEGKTLDSLEGMGLRLAEEVAEFLTQFHDQSVRRRKVLSKLSFVGHSMGNLIIRAALTNIQLRSYIPLLWMYMSVSGPHLGYMYSKNRVFDGGLLVLKSWRNARVLHQLTFTDAPKLEDTFLYKLAMASGLSLFRHVTLLASLQDGYVPFQSARVEMCAAAEKDSRRGAQYMRMVDALTRNFGNGPGQTRVLRVDVEFYQQAGKQQWALNRIVGRKAHIEFLESDLYIQFLLWTHFYETKILADNFEDTATARADEQHQALKQEDSVTMFSPREALVTPRDSRVPPRESLVPPPYT